MKTEISYITHLLEEHYQKIHTPSFIENDPLQFAHRYKGRNDIEVVALLCATIAWGRRKMILSSCEKMLCEMGASPYDYVMSVDIDRIDTCGRAVHRTFSREDFVFFIRGLRGIYSRYDTMEKIFLPMENETGTWEGINRFRSEMLMASHTDKNTRHISSPLKGSACKRLHLFLRWLVRDDGIDIGLWKNISPSELSIPLDVHVGNISRRLGILTRQSNDRRAVEEIDTFLRKIDPIDPVRYDFALFGIGESRYFENHTMEDRLICIQ